MEDDSQRATVICVTPVRNEEWILERFLLCASLWADYIIVADQGSDDDTPRIAASHPKVTLIENSSPAYDEAARQKLLNLPCLDEERRKSKMRWYQCWERLNNRALRPSTIYRMYHGMDVLPPDEIHPIKPEWFEGYTRRGIDVTERCRSASYYWDRE